MSPTVTLSVQGFRAGSSPGRAGFFVTEKKLVSISRFLSTLSIALIDIVRYIMTALASWLRRWGEPRNRGACRGEVGRLFCRLSFVWKG